MEEEELDLNLSEIDEQTLEQAITKLKMIAELEKSILGYDKEEAIARTVDKLSSKDDIEQMSLLDEEEIEELILFYIIGTHYNKPIFLDYVRKKLLLRSSLGAWKAKLLANIATEGRKEEKPFFGSIRRFFSKFSKKKETLETVEIG